MQAGAGGPAVLCAVLPLRLAAFPRPPPDTSDHRGTSWPSCPPAPSLQTAPSGWGPPGSPPTPRGFGPWAPLGWAALELPEPSPSFPPSIPASPSSSPHPATSLRVHSTHPSTHLSVRLSAFLLPSVHPSIQPPLLPSATPRLPSPKAPSCSPLPVRTARQVASPSGRGAQALILSSSLLPRPDAVSGLPAHFQGPVGIRLAQALTEPG